MDHVDGQSFATSGIVVSGTGRVMLDAEIATLAVGVSLTGDDLQRARADAATKVTAATDHLLASEVAAGDISTTRLNVHTSYDRERARQTYHLSTGLEATIRDLGSAQSVVDELFRAIGDGMDMRGLVFGVEDPTTGRDRAIELAFEDAKAKAEQLARLAGVSLGPVLALSESPGAVHQGVPMMRSAMTSTGAEIPIEAGSIEQRATVTVRWAIGG